MKRIFWVIGISLAVLILVVVIAVGGYLGPIIKLGMEQIGPKVTQVLIKVDTVDVALLTGSASIKGLTVGNPQGYTTPQAVHVGTVAVKLDLLSVTSSKILIQSIHIESPEITLEGGPRNNNLTKILDNVNAVTQNSGFASANTSTAEGSKLGPKIEVDDLLITGAKVHLNLEGMVNKDITLPDIHLTDLGKDSNGLTPSQLTSAVLSAVSKDALSVVTGTVINLGQGVSKISGILGGLLGK